jgi:hypothetical protein
MKKVFTFLLCLTLLTGFIPNYVVRAESDFWVKQIQATEKGLYLLRANGELSLLYWEQDKDKIWWKTISGSIAQFDVTEDGNGNIAAVKDDGRLVLGNSQDGLYPQTDLQKFFGKVKNARADATIINEKGELWSYAYKKDPKKITDNVKDYLYLSENDNNLYVVKDNGQLWKDNTKITDSVKKIYKRENFDPFDRSFYILKQNGDLLCYQERDQSVVPVTVITQNVTDLSVSGNRGRTIFALNSNNQLFGWGNNNSGQIGNDTKEYVNNEYMVLDHVKMATVHIGVNAGSYAIRENGEIWGWGDYNNSQVPKKLYKALSSGIIIPSGNYNGADAWAIPELTKADSKGLVKPVMHLAFNKNITREQFCEVVVKYFETLTGFQIPDNVNNPFTDTQNKEVLKAYSMGIVEGITSTKFSPNDYITREQLSVMLKRALDKAKPNYKDNYNYKRLEDERIISPWALDAVKKLRSIDVIQGDANNNFNPRDNTTVEQACLMAYRLLYQTE